VSTVARMVVGLALDPSDFDRNIRGVASAVSGLGPALAAAAGFASFSAAAALATREAIDLEHAMRQVQSIMGDPTQIDAATQAVKNLSTTFGAAPVEQARALYEVVSAGVTDTATATNVLTAANKLAIAGNADVRESALSLVATMNAYGVSMDKATDVSDAFFVAVRDGNVTVGELAERMGRLSPLGAAAGVGLDELLAAIAAITKGGISANTAIDGLRQVMQAVIKPTIEAQKQAKTLGLAFDAAAIRSKGLAGFLRDVQARTGGSADQLSQLFGPVEALVPVLSLVGNGADDFAQSLENMRNKAGATQAAFDIVAQSAKQRLAVAMATLRVEAINLAEKALPAIASAATTLVQNLGTLRDLVNGLARAVGVVGLVAALLSLRTAMVALSESAFVALAAGVTSVADAMALGSLAAEAFTAALGPVGIAALAIGALTLIFAQQAEAAREAADELDGYASMLAGIGKARPVKLLNMHEDLQRIVDAQAAQLKTAVDQGPEGFAMSDALGRSLEANRAKLHALDLEINKVFGTGVEVADNIARRTAKALAPSTALTPEAVVTDWKKVLGTIDDQVQALTKIDQLVGVAGINGGLQRTLTLHQQLTRFLHEQGDQLGENAAKIRTMLAELEKVRGFGDILGNRGSPHDVVGGSLALPFSQAVQVRPILPDAAPTSALESARARANLTAASDFDGVLRVIIPPFRSMAVEAVHAHDSLSLLDRGLVAVGIPLGAWGKAVDATQGALRTLTAGLANAGRNVLRALNPLTIFAEATNDVASAMKPLTTALAGPLARIAAVFSETLTPVVEALAPVFDALIPIVRAVMQVLGPILQALAPLLGAFTPILEALFPLFRLLAVVATYVIEAFARVAALILRAAGNIIVAFGKIVEALARAIDALPGVSAKGAIKFAQGIEHMGNAMLQTATTFQRTAESMNGVRDQIGGVSVDHAQSGLDALGDTANSVSEALKNVPSGFRVALARFESTAGEANVANVTTAGARSSVQITGPVYVDARTKPVEQALAELAGAARTKARALFGDETRIADALAMLNA
jgi:TP901 family phage tail tape measure protein